MNVKEENNVDEYEIREDEEQSIKFDEIIDLLVAAGYFRARIKGLSAFDKVVGGMIWSMDSCNFDVNADLLFQENSTIGHKIALTEKIVNVLPKMECPLRIEPHQIQGLDFVHIFPIIQWLVKKSVKIREEKKDFIRHHAILKFQKQFSSNDVNSSTVSENVQKLEDRYRRKRLFKRKGSWPKNEEMQVESTLLEYGFPYNPFDGEIQVHENVFSKTQEFADAFPLKLVGNIVNTQVQKIAEVSQQFARLQGEMVESGTSLMRKQKEMMLKKKNSLLEEKNRLENEIEINLKKSEKIKQELSNFDKADSMLKKDEKQMKVYDKLQSLILMEESLKNHEQSFKEYCRKELETLQNLVKESCSRNQLEESSLADKKCEEEREKVQNLRLQIAKKNRSIAFYQRQLDEVPGRGELAQYQRRFLELYNEVAQKHEETKQFYTMYNTLDDTKLYLSKELSLLNSVLDNYSDAMSNSIDKEEFMRQFESIVMAIKQNKQKVEKRRAEERLRRDKLSQQLLDLVEQQRNYVNVVKQLRIECKVNEELLARCRK